MTLQDVYGSLKLRFISKQKSKLSIVLMYIEVLKYVITYDSFPALNKVTKDSVFNLIPGKEILPFFNISKVRFRERSGFPF